jgi:hypothetical protein
MIMVKNDRLLAILLRCLGGGSLLALVAVMMPFSWMIGIHRWLGLGEMPQGPVVEYLARSVSTFYAFTGVLFLVVASDVERYRSLVNVLAIALVVMGILLLGVDVTAGMPWWWTCSEGPLCVGLGLVMFYLAGPVGPDRCVSEGPPPENAAMPISAPEARNRINEHVTVEMPVRAAKNCQHCFQVFLDSEKDHHDANNLAVAITDTGKSRFHELGIGEPALYFNGKTIRVKGVVTLKENRPQIIVDDPAQMEIVPVS